MAVADATSWHTPGVTPKSIVVVRTQFVVSVVVTAPPLIISDVQLSAVTTVSSAPVDVQLSVVALTKLPGLPSL